MRQERTVQASLFDLFAEHEIGRELKAMSLWLDEHRDLIGLAAEDLRRHGVTETGRQGLPAKSVLRCGLLKQHRQLSYEELAFHLENSASFRAFARLPLAWTPKKSVLHKTISAIRAETWEAINRILLDSARQERVETGKILRIDSTVAAALMHEPSDSSLLWDAVRVMTRLLREADALIGARFVWRDHRRAAKKRARAIEYARSQPNRVQHYRELIRLTRATLAYADRAAIQLWQPADPIAAALWQAESRHYRPLIERIVGQTERRVFQGETVAATEKIVSLFSRTPISSSKAAARLNTATSSTDHGPQRLDPQPGDRSRQSGGQRPVLAHARAPHRLLWPGPSTDSRRWRLCKPS